MCHRSLYQCSVKLFNHEKYYILSAELYHPVKSFDDKLDICVTYHKHLYKNEIPYHAMVFDPIPDELKDFKNVDKVPPREITLIK